MSKNLGQSVKKHKCAGSWEARQEFAVLGFGPTGKKGEIYKEREDCKKDWGGDLALNHGLHHPHYRKGEERSKNKGIGLTQHRREPRVVVV